MARLELLSPLTNLPGVGEKKASLFKKIDIETIEDLIFYAPREYLDYSEVSSTADLKLGKVTVQGRIASAPRSWRKNKRHITEVLFEDEYGQVKAIWFNQPYRAKQLRVGQEYVVSGELSFYGRGYSLVQPSVERVESDRLSTGVVVARYPETRGLSSRMILKSQKQALSLLEPIEIYPAGFLKEEDLIDVNKALNWLHFPGSEKESDQAKQRLGFDELFALQLSSRLTKEELKKKKSYKIKFNKLEAQEFVKSLDFKLTDGQRTAAWSILRDMNKQSPMNRMLEGDVGSGKTVVAAMGLLMSQSNGFQSVLLAPTTILASQHFDTLSQLLEPHGVEVKLLTRHSSAKTRREVLSAIRGKKSVAVVGTHALLSDKIEFHNLALIIIDEQHRFGVENREKLQSKTKLMPHVLTMTATPIPRSLALTLYGELDISMLKELPAGRKTVETKVIAEAAKLTAYKYVQEEVDKGNQAYIVAPRIVDTGDNMANIESLEKDLPKLIGRDIKTAVVHGKMKADDKDRVMQDYYDGKIQVLLGTTVIEVGVDNPGATVMIIEGAERFGLAQLHQLRGRIGRSDKKSRCYLVTSQGLEPTRRLNAMMQTNDGFKLAALDLKLRGPGSLYGTRQHGALDLNIADMEDSELLSMVSRAVDRFVGLEYDISELKLLNRRIESMRKATFLN